VMNGFLALNSSFARKKSLHSQFFPSSKMIILLQIYLLSLFFAVVVVAGSKPRAVLHIGPHKTVFTLQLNSKLLFLLFPFHRFCYFCCHRPGFKPHSRVSRNSRNHAGEMEFPSSLPRYSKKR
jgi:hypothetical protein